MRYWHFHSSNPSSPPHSPIVFRPIAGQLPSLPGTTLRPSVRLPIARDPSHGALPSRPKYRPNAVCFAPEQSRAPRLYLFENPRTVLAVGRTSRAHASPGRPSRVTRDRMARLPAGSKPAAAHVTRTHPPRAWRPGRAEARCRPPESGRQAALRRRREQGILAGATAPLPARPAPHRRAPVSATRLNR